MSNGGWLDLNLVVERVADVASRQLCIPRDEIDSTSRLVEDLQCDSLDLVELLIELEEEFLVTIPDRPESPVGKSIFTRRPFRICDLAELVYLQQGTGMPVRRGWRRQIIADETNATPFTQLSGRCREDLCSPKVPRFEPLGCVQGIQQYRRRSDGMRCAWIPAAEFTMGSDALDAQTDEQPVRQVALDAYLIDAEPVSTTAYCRFLNSVVATPANLGDWFLLDPADDRIAQMPILQREVGWSPVAGAETMPMVLVSWYGANAYSLWANGFSFADYRSEAGFLPSEAQWEHAATGAYATEDPPSLDASLVYGQHHRGAVYHAANMPMAPVHLSAGVSKFGLHHMAGNVWQWCRDWYAEDFYARAESGAVNPVNMVESGVRSERGGSWVGPLDLCRTSYRRGRSPDARGRCLGFRCVSPVAHLALH
ncbi:formylglycine-generating enzyme family protein [Blastopirellula marina]|uniref:Serine/threonine-protein kinase n=1 Tax=Blastopirellula marina DSM 3645 TaxID=314230 RepID=A4A0E1_9BACT|nr:SUMF1/EgtB/PvdO family nonheme iron enzyme [Blastopirellula marina]EAQ77761.1 serine/threonine-protein kinase [Blastopirellula marina DSM 3645]